MNTYRIEQFVTFGKAHRYVGIVLAKSASDALATFVLPEQYKLNGYHPLRAVAESGVTASMVTPPRKKSGHAK